MAALESNPAEAVDRTGLAEQLRQLGVTPGMVLMVHASLRRIGPIKGGAEALLDALRDVLGADGTLLMALGADDRCPFDRLTSPVEQDMGVLAEVFRRRCGASVNDHAAARFGALGPCAAELLEPVPLHDYHGPGSVLSRLTAMNGSVLRMGADIDTVTLTHYAEYLADLPDKRRVRIRYLRADIGEQWIESLDDSEGLVDWPDGDYFSRLLLDFLEAGHARIGAVGRSNAELFPAPAFVGYAVDWLETRLAR